MLKEKKDWRRTKMRKGGISLRDAIMLVVLAAFAFGGYTAYKRHQGDVARKERLAIEDERARREQAEREACERREKEGARHAEEKAARARAEAERRAQEDAERARKKRKAEQEEAERRRLAADREKWREEFNVAREKFSASLLLAADAPADEKPGSVRLAKTFWCVFPSYDSDRRIFVIDAAPGFMRVKSVMSDSGPEDVDAAVFKSRLSSEPYALTSGGNVWIGNVRAASGVYDIPNWGENLCIMESCLKELYPVAVALGIQPPEAMFNVYLRKKNAKDASNDKYVGEVLYGEIVERSKLEADISRALGSKTDSAAFIGKYKLYIKAKQKGKATTKKQGRTTMTTRRTKPVVMLNVGQPKLATKVVDKWKSRHSSSCDKEITKTRSYTGSVRCVLPKDEKAEICVEAFFVTSQMHGGMPQVSERTVVELFEFGDGSPQTRKFSFESPETKESKDVRSGWGWDGRGYYSNSRTAKRTGTKYLGVIVRAVIDGKVVKVVSVPNNAKWNTAAKEDTFTLQ